jgi:hypothetical protein
MLPGSSETLKDILRLVLFLLCERLEVMQLAGGAAILGDIVSLRLFDSRLSSSLAL